MRVPLLVVAVVVARVAAAQAPDAAKERAAAAYAEGTTAYNASEFLRAAIKFEEAYGHVPDPAYLFNIGQAYRQAQECVKSAAAFEKYIELVPSAPNVRDAKDLLEEVRVCAVFVEGRRLLGAGRPAEACEKFMLAHQADPGAVGTLLNLGLCSERSGKLATAASWFRQASKQARSVKLAEADKQAAARLTAIAEKIPKLDVRVTATGATVKLDGTPLVLHTGVEVDPGKHVLEISAPGMKPTTRSFEIAIAGRATVKVELEPIATRARSHKLAYIVGATGLALWTGTAVLGVLGKREYDDADTRDDQQTWKDIVRYGGTSMFVLGTAAITTSVVLYVRGRGARESPVVAPVAGADHVGVSLSGAF